ncbi:hypothetical protein ANANG_G00129410 [Anguilla anguilla]|uniref:Transferrin-like domain-containing protein n=1 Tax=Anguilla anguilla TaxID=7936 RepID=A0A9D3RXV3_ANGAN|nr:hypothetical protein ANANG_G00129410 [Anguilla anguilla]
MGQMTGQNNRVRCGAAVRRLPHSLGTGSSSSGEMVRSLEAEKKKYLHPIITEDYGPGSDTCFYAVAVAKAGTNFGFKDLKGKKSCHTGLGKSAGWNIPISTLLAQNQISWGGIDDESLVKAVSEFFSESCVPGADQDMHAKKYNNLCKLCGNDCSRTHKNPFYDDSGAFKCLVEGGGDVAFVKHTTVPDSEKSKYELLCKDGTRKSVNDFATCHLAKVPAHAVVSRKDADLADRIWQMLQTAMKFSLFSSTNYKAKDLLFRFSSQTGPDSQEHRELPLPGCRVYEHRPLAAESVKRQMPWRWMEGTLYTAGMCGLVPVMAEQYDEASFFSESCAPGADEGSSLCKLCKGKDNMGGVKCRASTEELYYGNSGAFRPSQLLRLLPRKMVLSKVALKSADFELLCLDNTRAPVSDYVKCHLAKVPAHAVVTRPEMRDQVVAFLKDQESLFGINGSNTGLFKMFQSEGSNLLFKDSTKCLQEVIKGQSFKDFLGKEYYDAVTSLKTCSTSVSELEKACTFHTCQQKV